MALDDCTTCALAGDHAPEVWQPIPPPFATAGRYEVSSYGRIRRVPRRDRLGRAIAARILATYKNTIWGTLYTKLPTRAYPVRAIVAAVFLGPLPDGYTLRHRDGDIRNVRLSNLVYVPLDAVLVSCTDPLEEWRPVAAQHDPDGSYEVSNLGRVRRRARVDTMGRPVRGGMLPLHTMTRGSVVVRVGTRTLRVHTLVTEAFLGLLPAGDEIPPCDGNPCKNHLRHLASCSHADTCSPAADAGLMARGIRSARTTLTAEDVRAIRAAQGTRSAAILAARYGVSSTHIYAIWHRKTWAWLA